LAPARASTVGGRAPDDSRGPHGAGPGDRQGGTNMLVLTRRIDEEIIIGDDIRVTVLAIQGNTVRLGFTAPRSVRIMRPEARAGPGRAAASDTRAGSANARGGARVGATEGTRS